MALIKCPECGKDVSDTITQCIHCGFFLKKQNNGSTTQSNSNYDVVLKSSGSGKLGIIKLVMEITGLGLKEAKDLVDAVPSKIARNIPNEEAKAIANQLKQNGAEVDVVEVGKPIVPVDIPKAQENPNICANCAYCRKNYNGYFCSNQSNAVVKGIFEKRLEYRDVSLNQSCGFFTEKVK